MKFDTGIVERRFKKRVKLSFTRRVKFRKSEIKFHKVASRTSTPTFDENQNTSISHVIVNATNLLAYLNIETLRFDTRNVQGRKKTYRVGLKWSCQISVLEN